MHGKLPDGLRFWPTGLCACILMQPVAAWAVGNRNTAGKIQSVAWPVRLETVLDPYRTRSTR